ncbi:MAG: amidohydrolase family protein [Proteobacteria bacterium]|nr:amidohydrolase family protein [Pseudomonadota bacterium]
MSKFETIDIHAHFYPEAYMRLVEAEGAEFGVRCTYGDPNGPVIEVAGVKSPPLESRYINIDDRVASMDEMGVDVHCLSLTQPMLYWAPPDLSQRLTVAYNDACVEAHEAYPDRFLGLAILPMQEPALALAELERVKSLPGIRGVYMATRVLDMELSDPSLFPIYEAIEDLGFTIFLHPIKVVDPSRLKQFYLTNFIGNPTESAIAASHLIFGEVLDRFPKLTFCLPHAGGTFPWLIGRITHGWGVRDECKHLKNPPVDYLRRFYYDTITHAAPALEYLINLVGPDRVVLGSDFCFDMSYDRPVEVVTGHAGLSEEDQALILSGNAKRLLGM